MDIIALNTSEGIVGIIYEFVEDIPELEFFAASPVKKTYYKVMVRTKLPTSGFRNLGEGRVRDKGTLEQRLVNCMILDAGWDEDMAAFSGATFVGGENANLVEELQRAHMLSALKNWQWQIYNGTTAGTKGFQGLATMFPTLGTPGLINAGGTTANTGSSIYAVKTGTQDVSVVWGMDGQIQPGEIYKTLKSKLNESDEMEEYDAFAQDILGWSGLQLANNTSVVRVANITEDAGSTCNDAMLSKALFLFKKQHGSWPDGLLMGHRTWQQLHQSRVATSESGKEADIPEVWQRVKIIPTHGITDTEALVAA
jgi:hypothetical protein